MRIDVWSDRNNNKITRKFFLFAICISIIVIYSVTYTVLESTNLGVMNNCINSKVGDPIFIQKEKIINSKTAEVILDEYFNETHRFLKADLSDCGASYIFNGVQKSYMVCENGKVYEYGKICKI